MPNNHLNKQAKNLKKLLPEFLKQHSAKPPLLADFQELIARTHGYPSYHAANAAGAKEAESRSPKGGILNVEVVTVSENFYDLKEDGTSHSGRVLSSAIFTSKNPDFLEETEQELDSFLAQIGYSEEYGDDALPPEYSVAMIKACKKLVQSDSSFIDGYAHWVSALVRLNRASEAIETGTAIYNELVSLLPPKFRGRINYYELENRPFHRLAYNLALAHLKLETKEGDLAAAALKKQMLHWWPNDNMGFRFLE